MSDLVIRKYLKSNIFIAFSICILIEYNMIILAQFSFSILMLIFMQIKKI